MGTIDTRSTTTFGHYRGEVEVMLACGCAFRTIEESIDSFPLGADERAALWLVAWSLANRQDSDAELTLEPLTLRST